MKPGLYIEGYSDLGVRARRYVEYFTQYLTAILNLYYQVDIEELWMKPMKS